ncbi:MAG TPA: type II toxin-antitoxin system RelE/ParE family toxin [Myxococcales bacterium]|nr:type II toxin-antitoxin system RelE/ParE family toxin [Myxococcales bacterium]
MIVYTNQALADLGRLEAIASGAVALIVDAIGLLDRHPFIGRVVENGRREFVISRGKTGHLALYDFDERANEVTVTAVRHQRETGYEP